MPRRTLLDFARAITLGGLLDLLLVRKEPEGDLTEVNVVDLLKLIRSKPHKH